MDLRLFREIGGCDEESLLKKERKDMAALAVECHQPSNCPGNCGVMSYRSAVRGVTLTLSPSGDLEGFTS
jgi:hypothetical protein